MQPTRTLQDILAELKPVYQPQIDLVRQQQAAIPQQLQDSEQQLQAKQNQAFGDILNGARQRGLGFSGIPLGEQAKYTSTEYLPALANLRTTSQNNAMSLENAILGIQERQSNAAQSIYQTEQDRAAQLEAARRAAAAQSAAFGGLFGGSGTLGTSAPTPTDPYASIDKQKATNAIKTLLDTKNGDLIKRTIAAVTDSANRGNLYDKFKLELLNMYKTNSAYGNLFKNLANPTPSKTLPVLMSNAAPLANGAPLLNIINAKR